MRLLSIVTVLLFLVTFSVFSQSSKLDVSISSKADRNSLRVGEKVRFEVTVSWSGAPTDYDIGTTTPPSLVGLRMLSTASSISSEGGSGAQAKRTMIYELEATDAGKAKIGAVELTVRDRKSDKKSTLSTEPLELEVQAAPAPIFALPSVSPRRALGVGLILLALVAAGAGIFLRSRGSDGKIKPDETPAETTPEQAFDDVLRAAGGLRFSGDVQNYIVRLEGAILKWIETRFAMNPRQWPDAVISECSARALLPAEHIEHLRQFARCCQAVKFAGERPPAEELDRLVGCLSAVVHHGTETSSQGSK